MVTIGLTGGIGSGKSTVVRLLERRGARVIDADAISHRLMAPGTPGHDAVVRRFGAAVVGPDGSIDRRALAALVFTDPAARIDLEAIIHPLVGAVIRRELDAAEPGEVVVCVLPLLAETDARHRYRFDGVIVVDAPEELVLARLVQDRHMDETDARARIAAQTDRFARLALADYVILNVGTLEELEEMIEGAWRWIDRLGRGSAAPPASNGEGR